jgi:hypothetical protein
MAEYPETWQPSALEKEIRDLEQKLAERKQALERGGGAAVTTEKEVFRDVLKEHISEARTPMAGGSSSSLLTDQQKAKAASLARKTEREEQLRELVEYALAHSALNAVRVAQEATPYLLDELHDRLADDYYDKLVALRKVKIL